MEDERLIEERHAALEAENEKLRKRCPKLLSGYEEFPIPEHGWIEPVREACLEIEALNEIAARHGLTATLQQSKEKFGTLRMYVDVLKTQPSFWRRWLAKAMSKAAFTLGDYGYWLFKLADSVEFPEKFSEKQSHLADMLQLAAGDIVASATSRCSQRCMLCGKRELDGAELVWTRGYIRRICRKCADQLGALVADSSEK